ncbi:N-acetylmuramic acid 6-phosphate etherase [uncultured Tateyamaria sp.]|uniref:N-acetylmuramic acid 6-phosphate etherase n=1 Tax=Tateyamaria sp. 1078 TaxID=3417464 RepID=UPI002635B663|nr:N-acetylmuramic acid 6-phosphate etherase [uncultured Tateyamaria sp.]
MLLPATENVMDGDAIDALLPQDAVARMVDVQLDAVEAVRRAAAPISDAANLLARTVQDGKSIIYAAAGSSGLMALADACELPGTFGIAPEQIQIHMAGGIPIDGRMPGDTEDDTDAARDAARAAQPGDAVIVLSASGTTPYAVQMARAVRDAGARVIGIANNPDTDLLNAADIAICLQTPPEVIAGSTRMGAGTAQKVALNLMSSLMGVKLGHVYGGMMVNVVADNAKLLDRSARMVARIANVADADAARALAVTSGHVKPATLVAAGLSHADAKALLRAHDGHLGPCLHAIAPEHQ